MKYVSIDIETCGLNPKEDSILEFGAVIDDLTVQAPLAELPRFHCYIIPKETNYSGHPAALAMHTEIFKRVAKPVEGLNYRRPNNLGGLFTEFLISCGYKNEPGAITINVAGKNFSGFDNRFLEEQTNFHDFIRPRHRVIDVTSHFVNQGDEVLPDLKTCLSRAGIEKQVEHTAIADALDVVSLVRWAIGGIYKSRELLP